MAKRYSVENVKVNNLKQTVDVTVVESSTFKIANLFSRPKKISKTLPLSVLRVRSKSKSFYINEKLKTTSCVHQGSYNKKIPAYYYSGETVDDFFGLGDIFLYLLIFDYLESTDEYLLQDFEAVATYQEENYDPLEEYNDEVADEVEVEQEEDKGYVEDESVDEDLEKAEVDNESDFTELSSDIPSPEPVETYVEEIKTSSSSYGGDSYDSGSSYDSSSSYDSGSSDSGGSYD